MSVSIVASAIVFAGAFLLSLRSPWVGGIACVALLPWSGIEVDPGIRLTAYRLVLFGWIGALAVRGIAESRRATRPTDGGRLYLWGIGFLAYAVAWSLVQLPFVPTTDVGGSLLRAVPQLRSIGQVGWFLLRFAPLLILPAVLSRMGQGISLARVYLASLAVLTVVGFVQLGVWVATGVDLAPIGGVSALLGGSGDVRHGFFVAFGRQVLRMSSFGGEPKHTGQGLAVGLLILQAGSLLRSMSMKRIVGVWVLFFLGMLATASTSALYVWSGGTLVLVAYFLVARPAGRASVQLHMLGVVGLASVTVAAVAALIGLSLGEVGELLTMRTLERPLIPDFDLAVWGFLFDHPRSGILGVGLGNIHAYAATNIPDFARRYMENSIFVANSGYLRLLSEVGLLGLALFLVWMWREVQTFSRLSAPRVGANAIPRGQDDGETETLHVLMVGLAVVMVLAFLARGFLWDEAVWTVAVLRSTRLGAAR